MNVDKTRVSRARGSKSDIELDLDGHLQNVDQGNVLDLLVVIDDERRFHAAAALLTEDPVDRERYRAMARDDTALLASIRHCLARVTRSHASRRERIRQLELYAYRLMNRSQQPRRYALASTTNLQGGQ